MPSMRAPGGWRVEQITGDRGAGDRQVLRVSRHGVYVGEARTADELAGLGVPVADLVED